MTLCVDKDEAMSGAESSELLHSETTPESTPPLEEEEDDPSVNFYTSKRGGQLIENMGQTYTTSSGKI